MTTKDQDREKTDNASDQGVFSRNKKVIYMVGGVFLVIILFVLL